MLQASVCRHENVEAERDRISVSQFDLVELPARTENTEVRDDPAPRANQGDGFHGGSNPTADAAMPEFARRLRQQRPDASTFTISMYTHDWDPAEVDADVIKRQRDTYEEAGIQHLVIALSRRDIDSWLGSMERVAAILDV